MEAKEKAEQLLLKFLKIDNNTKEWFNKYMAKQCALISVQEIINGGIQLRYGNYINKNDKLNYYTYWEQVKNEIEKL